MSIRLESVYKICKRNKKISAISMEYINNTKLISDWIEMITIDTMQIYCLYDVPDHYIIDKENSGIYR